MGRCNQFLSSGTGHVGITLFGCGRHRAWIALAGHQTSSHKLKHTSRYYTCLLAFNARTTIRSEIDWQKVMISSRSGRRFGPFATLKEHLRSSASRAPQCVPVLADLLVTQKSVGRSHAYLVAATRSQLSLTIDSGGVIKLTAFLSRAALEVKTLLACYPQYL